MTRRPSFARRCLGTVAASGLVLLLLAPNALAETREITSGFWAGSKSTTPERVAIPDQPITALIKRGNTFVGLGDVVIVLNRAPGIPAACTVATGNVSRADSTSEGVPVSAATNVTCNGAYPYTIDASDQPPLSGPRNMPTIDAVLVVEVPPPAVTGVSASVPEGSRSVTVSWSATSSQSPDFLGYRIQRRLGSGQWVTVTATGKGSTSVVDTEVPADPGTYSYRVLGRRSGAGDNEVLSGEGNIDKVTLTAGDPSTTTTAGDGTTTPTNPDGSGGGSTGGSTTPSTTADGKLIPRIVNSGKGRGRVTGGTPAPRLGSSTQDGLGVLLTPVPGEGLAGEGDEGYNQELPFGDPNIDDGSLADEEEGSSIFIGGTGGRGMAIPVAVGFVFFAWAIHLRFLARASRPEPGHVTYAEAWDPFDPFYDPML